MRPAALRLVLATDRLRQGVPRRRREGDPPLRHARASISAPPSPSHPDKELARARQEAAGPRRRVAQPGPAEGDRGVQADPGQDRRRRERQEAVHAALRQVPQALAARGPQIGPDLTGFAVHPKEEILIHILDPSRSVEGNFKLYRVVTTDDRTILGILGATTGDLGGGHRRRGQAARPRQGRDRVDEGDRQVADAGGVREGDEARRN